MNKLTMFNNYLRLIMSNLEEARAGSNPGLAKVALQCSADKLVVNQILVLRINICGENRHLRQYPKGWQKYLPTMRSIITSVIFIFTAVACSKVDIIISQKTGRFIRNWKFERSPYSNATLTILKNKEFKYRETGHIIELYS